MNTNEYLKSDKRLIQFEGNSDEPVGFSAYATVERTYTNNDIVLYDELISNFGEYFDLDLDVFVCPYSGIYWFSLSCYNDPGYGCLPAITIEGNMLVQAIGPTDNEDRNSGSVSTIAECNAGQRVWVKNGGTTSVYSIQNARANTFSGFFAA